MEVWEKGKLYSNTNRAWVLPQPLKFSHTFRIICIILKAVLKTLREQKKENELLCVYSSLTPLNFSRVINVKKKFPFYAVSRPLLTIGNTDPFLSRGIGDNGQHLKLFKRTLELKLQPSFPCNFSSGFRRLLVSCHGVDVNEILL